MRGKTSTTLVGMKRARQNFPTMGVLDLQMLIAVISMQKGWDGNGGCSCIIYINKVQQCYMPE